MPGPEANGWEISAGKPEAAEETDQAESGRLCVGRATYYVMGLHRNGAQVWQSVSTNGLAFPAARPLLTNLDAADAYIVALGWVTRGPQESPGRKLLGVLYN